MHVVCDHTATCDEELSVRRAEAVHVVATGQQGALLVRRVAGHGGAAGAEGWVPACVVVGKETAQADK